MKLPAIPSPDDWNKMTLQSKASHLAAVAQVRGLKLSWAEERLIAAHAFGESRPADIFHQTTLDGIRQYHYHQLYL
jgi:hypothetical protein